MIWKALFVQIKRHCCKHDYIPARQFYQEYEGIDHPKLAPKPMGKDWKAEAYVCRKCYDYFVQIGPNNHSHFNPYSSSKEQISDGTKV